MLKAQKDSGVESDLLEDRARKFPREDEGGEWKPGMGNPEHYELGVFRLY
jgi:hypothetical protein